MSDDEHPELDFDPLDDTKTWPEDQFPLRPVGMMTLNRNVGDRHNENEQIAFGTGVLVDGLDFSDDKMLIGRTFSYSDTQRYRVGPNYLQLPVNRPDESVVVSTNQGGGQMSYGVDNRGGNPHINFEPSTVAGLQRGRRVVPGVPPVRQGQVQKAPIERENNYAQAGERYRTMPRVGARRSGPQPDRTAGPVRQGLQEKMVVALQPVRRGVWPTRRRGPRPDRQRRLTAARVDRAFRPVWPEAGPTRGV